MMNNIPVTIPYFTDKESRAVEEVLQSGWVAQGPKVAIFEKKISAHEGVSDGVATTSCTTALHLALVANGLGSGMDVIVPAFTFVATANAVVESGATPVFVDINRETFNVSVSKLENLISNQYYEENGRIINNDTGNVLWGIVPVHEFGLCCNIISINKIAQKYNLKIVEDAACALGAKINNTHPGAFGNLACISFHPRKSITTGEGGMILLNDRELAQRMRQLRTHGSSMSADSRHNGGGFLLPEFNEAGFNYCMTDIQAAVGIAQVEKLDYILTQKIDKAIYYNKIIREKTPELIPPYVPDGYYHTYQSYVCMLDIQKLGITTIHDGGEYRNTLLKKLEKRGIATRQGTHAVHMLGYYKEKYHYVPEDYPNAYACDHLSITLPLYVQMNGQEQDYVINVIREELDKM